MARHTLLKRSDSTRGGCGPPEGKVRVLLPLFKAYLLDWWKIVFFHYLASLVYGDGAFYYDRWSRMYYVYLYDKDRSFLERIAVLAKQHSIRCVRIRSLKGKNSYELRIGGKLVYDNLKKLISKLIRSPDTDFIRGLTDAEGCIYLDKYNGLTIEIANTK
jgi:hypothetical protein